MIVEKIEISDEWTYMTNEHGTTSGKDVIFYCEDGKIFRTRMILNELKEGQLISDHHVHGDPKARGIGGGG